MYVCVCEYPLLILNDCRGDSRETTSSKRHHKKHVNIATPPHNRKSYARSVSKAEIFTMSFGYSIEC